jgi:hypothetical protein
MISVFVIAGQVTGSSSFGVRATTGCGSLPAELLAQLEGHVRLPVRVGKIEGLPKEVSWHYNVRSPMLKDPTRHIDTYVRKPFMSSPWLTCGFLGLCAGVAWAADDPNKHPPDSRADQIAAIKKAHQEREKRSHDDRWV